MNPLSPSGYGAAVARGKRILGWLHEEGAFPTEECEHALVQIATLRVPVPGRRADGSLHAVLRLERELRGAGLAGRPIVDTTIDLELQRALTWKAVAWSTKYLVGVWVGHPDYRPMRELPGFRSAAELAAKTLAHLHGADAHGLADLSFPHPRGTSLTRLCAMSGRRAVHVRRASDERSGALATRATPPEHAQVRSTPSRRGCRTRRRPARW